MTTQTRKIVILCVVISIIMFGMGIVIGYFNGETATKANKSSNTGDITSRAGSCSPDSKWSEEETR